MNQAKNQIANDSISIEWATYLGIERYCIFVPVFMCQKSIITVKCEKPVLYGDSVKEQHEVVVNIRV